MKIKTLTAIAIMAIVSSILLTSCNSEDVDSSSYTDNTELWPAYNNGKYGYINRKGAFVIPAQYDGVSNFSCGYARVSINGRKMFIDKNGKIQNTPSFDNVYGFWNNYAIIEINDKYGLMNKNFGYVLQPIYYDMGDAGRNGLVPVNLSSGDKWGYLNTKGETKISAIYDYASMFVGDYARVRAGSKYGIINSNGEYIIQPIYDFVYPLGNNRFAFYEYNRAVCGLLNEKGKIIVPALYDWINDNVCYFKWSLLPVYNNDEKAGYIDKDGNVIIPFQFDGVAPFNEGYACVELNDIDMIIDEKGSIVLQLAKEEYFATGYIHNGLTLTMKNNTYYYKDIKGNVVYTWTESSNAAAPVKKLSNHKSLKKEEQHPHNPLIYYLGEK